MERKKGSYALPAYMMILLLACVVTVIPVTSMSLHAQSRSGTLADVPRIAVDTAREKSSSGEALLVCAYDSDERFNTMRLDGAISLREFKMKLTDISRTREIIFYCA